MTKPALDFEQLARDLAGAWLRHVYNPGRGTVEAYVAARNALVYGLFPEFLSLPASRAYAVNPRPEALELLARVGISPAVERRLQEVGAAVGDVSADGKRMCSVCGGKAFRVAALTPDDRVKSGIVECVKCSRLLPMQ